MHSHFYGRQFTFNAFALPYDVGVARVVDVKERRTRIAAAVWRIVAGLGIDAVSLRSVALEAGVSMGQVQHYYSTKNDLLFAGVEHSYQLVEQRLEQSVDSSSGSPRELMLAILTLLLGNDPTMREAIRVNVAFAARTQNEPRVHDLLTAGDDEVIDLCTQVISRAQHDGLVDSGVDPVFEARVLFALATGLGTQVSLYDGAGDQALEVFSYYSRRLGITS